MDLNRSDDDGEEAQSNFTDRRGTGDLSSIVEDFFKRRKPQEQPNMELPVQQEQPITELQLSSSSSSSSSRELPPRHKNSNLNVQLTGPPEGYAYASNMQISQLGNMPLHLPLAGISPIKNYPNFFLESISPGLTNILSPNQQPMMSPYEFRNMMHQFWVNNLQSPHVNIPSDTGPQKSEEGIVGSSSRHTIIVTEGEDIIGRIRSFSAEMEVAPSSVFVMAALGGVNNPILKLYTGSILVYEGAYLIFKFCNTISKDGSSENFELSIFNHSLDGLANTDGVITGEVNGMLIAAGTTYVHVMVTRGA
ncbi:uncharacterized protein LOC115706529 isoform X1 [Cannabis sativa]|uniref:uncharacterized protein LOC115706529 isoform X1 n=1 Tax=Cannabis sativa TaxID=3483 RepID=UPI0029C9B646|nr:uncharacterized protein LOC115706529 isoform X1 [Cannabis sativa]